MLVGVYVYDHISKTPRLISCLLCVKTDAKFACHAIFSWHGRYNFDSQKWMTTSR